MLKHQERWAIHLYSNTPPHVQAPPGRIRGILEWVLIILINAPARIRTRNLWLWYHILGNCFLCIPPTLERVGI
jgi:hypothetical protein